jgi:N-acetylmuramoyl-L-alanine amidase
MKAFLFCFFFITIALLGLPILVAAQNSSLYSQRPGSGSLRNFRVVLDPGHGGRDSATRANGVYEKNLVLEIAKIVKGELQGRGFEVVMTRDTDDFISLPDRAAVTGDVFISIHANTVADTIGPSVRSMIKGMDIYTDENMQFSPDLPQRSKLLASQFQQSLRTLQGIRMRGIRQKSLAVLTKNQSPAILIELGFLSNEEDLKFLTATSNQKKLAEAFVKAIVGYQNAVR